MLYMWVHVQRHRILIYSYNSVYVLSLSPGFAGLACQPPGVFAPSSGNSPQTGWYSDSGRPLAAGRGLPSQYTHTWRDKHTLNTGRSNRRKIKRCITKYKMGCLRSGLWISVPITVSSYITGQSLRQVRPDPIQLLWSWQRIKCQLLHVSLYQPILQT